MLNQRKASARLIGERDGFLLGPQQFADGFDLGGDPVRRGFIVNHGQGNARIGNQLERSGRTGAVDRDYP